MADGAFWRGKRVVVTGGAGFIGSRLCEHLRQRCGVAAERIAVPRSQDSDLRDFGTCLKVVEGSHVVIHLAAVTGGIAFSRAHPASQYFASTKIDLNIVEAARIAGVEKLVAIGNLFAYAPDVPQPMSEDALFDGLPTDAHRGVGSLKRNLALLADLYHREYGFPMTVVYSANAYGPGDSLHFQHAHVIPATIMKCFRDPEIVVWGDGSPTRDFLFVDDVAAGLILAAEKLTPPEYINIGSGVEISVRDLVTLIAAECGFSGRIEFDTSKSGGDARRCADVRRARSEIGFVPKVSIQDGLRRTVAWYRQQLSVGSVQ